MNVLLTCAGRRNYLIHYFKAALQERGTVFAADVSLYAPALHEADHPLIVESVTEPTYIETLVRICQQNDIRLLVPLNDLELPILAAASDTFRAVGTVPLVSKPGVIDICFDKWAMLDVLRECNINVPTTFLNFEDASEAIHHGTLRFPVVIKPRWGSASIGIMFAHDLEELELCFRLVKKSIQRTILADASSANPDECILIQEALSGQEYGLDVVNDLDGNTVAVFVKRKIAMRAGETDKAVTVEFPELSELGKLIGRHIKHIGNLDCDVFVSETGIYVLEMNPRFGGGYPFSHFAGANLPSALLAWLDGKEPNAEWLQVRPNVFSAKCDRLVGNQQ